MTKHITAEWSDENGIRFRVCDGRLQQCIVYKQQWVDRVDFCWSKEWLIKEIASGRFKSCDKYEKDVVELEFSGSSGIGNYRLTVNGDNSKLEWRYDKECDYFRVVKPELALVALYEYFTKK